MFPRPTSREAFWNDLMGKPHSKGGCITSLQSHRESSAAANRLPKPVLLKSKSQRGVKAKDHTNGTQTNRKRVTFQVPPKSINGILRLADPHTRWAAEQVVEYAPKVPVRQSSFSHPASAVASAAAQPGDEDDKKDHIIKTPPVAEPKRASSTAHAA